MNAEIKEIERKIAEARLVQALAADVHKKAEEDLRAADADVGKLIGELRKAQEAADRKLPQCKIVRTSRWSNSSAVDACIVGTTKTGMLRVRQIGFDDVELFKLACDTGRYESRGGLSWNKDYLLDVPPEFMPESAK